MKEERAGPWIAIGCGAVVVLLILSASVVYFTWRRTAASIVRASVVQMLEQSSLPPGEGERVLETVDRVLDQFVEGDLTREQLEKLGVAFKANPLSRVFVILSLKAKYVDAAGLDEERKKRADRNIERLLRSVMEKRVTDRELRELTRHLPRKGGAPPPDENDDVTLEALFEKIDVEKELEPAKLQELLDAVGQLVEEIPDEEYTVQVAEELERIVDEALAEKSGGSE